MLIIESNIFIHKCIFEGIPTTINELITFSINREKNVRSIRMPLIRIPCNSVKANQSLIYRAVFLYNKLPDIYRTYNINKFKKYTNIFIKETSQTMTFLKMKLPSTDINSYIP